MATLVDKDILLLAESGALINCVKENIQSIGYDLRTGGFFDLGQRQKAECSLVPGDTIFVECVESINLPADIAAKIVLRNSRIRQGLQLDAPIYHPGHNTQVYFRISNISKTVIDLNTHDELASIIFEKLHSSPQKVYDGAFQDEKNYKGMASYTKEYMMQTKDITENIFVLMPFREVWSDMMYKQLKMAAKPLKMQIYRADEVYGIKPVISDIVKGIQNARIIISVMTGGNKNVNYELGLAHAWRKPSIMITSSKEDIPFDYQHLRIIYYNENNPNWGKDLVKDIVKTVNSIKGTGLTEYNYFKD